MGAWGAGSFDNDGVLDWVWDLEKVQDASFLRETLRAVIGEDSPDAAVCEPALGAAETVAALRGKPPENLPEEVAKWVGAHASLADAELARLAASAVTKIKTSSELKDLWDESEEAGDWYAVLDGLLARLA